MSVVLGQEHGRGSSVLGLESFVTAWRGLIQPTAQPAGLDPEDLLAAILLLSPELCRRRASGADSNVWKIAGVGRNEVRNTAVLAWLLSPHGSHGLGGRILSALMNNLCQHRTFEAESVSDALVVAEERPMGSLDDRIDISIDVGIEVVFIEAKIDAPFPAGQLERYKEQLRLKALAYGAEGSTLATLTVKALQIDNVPSLTWSTLASIVRSATDHAPESFGKSLALQYADHIEQFW